jgi:methionine-gamma-lyase
MKFNPADNIQDLQYFGEFGVNPSISDSSTYTFLSAKTMFDTFEGNMEGCYLYSRHSSPSNLYLDRAMAAMETLKQQTYPLPEWELRYLDAVVRRWRPHRIK